jgi:hypothetical protein
MKFDLVIRVLISKKRGEGGIKYFTQLYHCKNIFFFEGSRKCDVYECKIPRLFRPKIAERPNAGFCI